MFHKFYFKISFKKTALLKVRFKDYMHGVNTEKVSTH